MLIKDLARYIVHKCVDDGYPVTNLQLQKILYLLEAGGYSRTGARFETWAFGPCVPEIYYNYAYYGAMPISDKIGDAPEIDAVDKIAIDILIENTRTMLPWELNDAIRIREDMRA